MRRLVRRASTVATAAVLSTGGRGASTGEVISNSFAAGTETSAEEPHPLLYQVPVLASRTIGRTAEVRALWQHLLSGRRYQVLFGVDGIGKSTIAAEFCDAVRHSQRFSCIQWFNAQHALPSQLRHFFASMQGRREKDVLLVLDDVAAPEDAVSLIPEHANVFVLMTTSATDVASTTKVACLSPPPLSPQASQQFSPEPTCSPEVDTIFHNLGHVPLLMHVAALLLDAEVCSAPELCRVLVEKEVRRDDTLSISAALAVLLDLGIAALEATYPAARAMLRVISCFHTSDISDAVLGAVVGDAGGEFAVAASRLGIFSIKWEDGAFALHPLTATVLRGPPDAAVVGRAADALLTLWPRRWRGMGSHVAYHLVWHTYALAQHCAACGARLTPALVTSMDRSATFLAHIEARDLTVAGQLWWQVYAQHVALSEPASAESVRMLRECGRLFHFLKDPRAEEVLQRAWQDCVAVHGSSSAESALLLGCLGPYLPATTSNMALVEAAVAVLEARLSSVDVVLAKEEVRMLWQTVFVLLMCKGQYMVEMQLAVPDDLRRAIDRADAAAKKVI
ncbi:NADH-ubiquinone oxidoreductase complex I subunit [Novymonas esmeraldas]|uniref:NADH-ubiquinone oxidoreductase complex I subunit n=1 Tax=Novymonas esmeraldas TaxID=1808958 RepID=A0AAW0F6G6_9TRYP